MTIHDLIAIQEAATQGRRQPLAADGYGVLVDSKPWNRTRSDAAQIASTDPARVLALARCVEAAAREHKHCPGMIVTGIAGPDPDSWGEPCDVCIALAALSQEGIEC